MAKKRAKQTKKAAEPDSADQPATSMDDLAEAIAGDLMGAPPLDEQEVPTEADQAPPEAEEQPAADEDQEQEEQPEDKPEADSAREAWDQLPEDVRQKIIAEAQPEQPVAVVVHEPASKRKDDEPPKAEVPAPELEALKAKVAQLRTEGFEEVATSLEAVVDYVANTDSQRRQTVDQLSQSVKANETARKAQEAQGQFDLAFAKFPKATIKQQNHVIKMVAAGMVEGEGNVYEAAFAELFDVVPKDSKPKPRSTPAERETAAAVGSGVTGTESDPAEIDSLDAESIEQAITEGSPMFAGLMRPD